VEASDKEDLVKKRQTILEACRGPLPRNPNNGERKDGQDQDNRGRWDKAVGVMIQEQEDRQTEGGALE